MLAAASPPRISLADLDETKRAFLAGDSRRPRARDLHTRGERYPSFLRHQWYMDHIFQDAEHSRPDGFMRINYTSGPEGEKKTSRVLDFAENLFNLQHVEGFDDRVDQMRTGSIEATLLSSTSRGFSTSTTLISVS